MKTILLLAIATIASFNSSGQDIIEFLIPQSEKMTAVYEIINEYADEEKETYSIKFEKLNEDEFDMTINYYEISTVKTIEVLPNEVLWTKSNGTAFFGELEEEIFEKPRTLLKIPTDGEIAEWTILDSPYYRTYYQSSWTTVTLDGQIKKALKVESQKGDEKKIHHYVQGIGLWKSETIQSNGEATDDFKFLKIE